jgi:hypothetical protein
MILNNAIYDVAHTRNERERERGRTRKTTAKKRSSETTHIPVRRNGAAERWEGMLEHVGYIGYADRRKGTNR